MAINYNYAIKYSTSKIVSRAYREYATETAEAYGRLVSMVSQAVEYENIQNRSADGAVDEILQQFSEYGYEFSSPVVLPSGAIKLGDLLNAIVTNNINSDNAIDLDEIPNSASVTLVNELGSVNKSISDVLTDLQNCFHAAVVDQGAAIAFDNGGTVSEMVSMLRDSVMSVFSNGYTDFSNTLNATIDKIKSGVGVVEYVEEKLVTSGIKDSAEKGTTFDQSQDYTFTGSSVASAQSWKSAATQVSGAIGQAVRTAATAVVGTIKGIINVGKKLFKKVVSKLRQIFVDPYDINEINGVLGNHTVNGFQYQQQISLTAGSNRTLLAKLNKGPIHMDFIPCEVIMQAVNNDINLTPVTPKWSLDDFISYSVADEEKFNDKFIEACSFIFPDQPVDFTEHDNYLSVLNSLMGNSTAGTFNAAVMGMLYYANIEFSELDEHYLLSNPNTWSWLQMFSYICDIYKSAADAENNRSVLTDVLFKIKPIDHRAVFRLLQSYGIYNDPTETEDNKDTYTYNLGMYLDVLDRLKLEDGMYTTVTRVERDLYLDFMAGRELTNALMSILSLEAQGQSSENIRATVYRVMKDTDIYDYVENAVPDTVTNENFFNLFTKFQGFTFNDDDNFLASNVASMLTSVFDYRAANPFDYEFFPYSQNYADWFMPSFELKSDQINESAFVDFVSKAVLVIIVATIATTAVVTLRKLSMKANLKQKAAELVASDKAVVGRFDKEDLKNLRKTTRRAKLLNTLTGGLTSTATQVGVSDFFGSDIEPIVTLIRG